MSADLRDVALRPTLEGVRALRVIRLLAAGRGREIWQTAPMAELRKLRGPCDACGLTWTCVCWRRHWAGWSPV